MPRIHLMQPTLSTSLELYETLKLTGIGTPTAIEPSDTAGRARAVDRKPGAGPRLPDLPGKIRAGGEDWREGVAKTAEEARARSLSRLAPARAAAPPATTTPSLPPAASRHGRRSAGGQALRALDL
jgi:hypothetical protein